MPVSNPYLNSPQRESVSLTGVQTGLSKLAAQPNNLKRLGESLAQLGKSLLKNQRDNELRQMTVEANAAAQDARTLYGNILLQMRTNPTLEQQKKPFDFMANGSNRVYNTLMKKFKANTQLITERDKRISTAIQTQLNSYDAKKFIIGSHVQKTYGDYLTRERLSQVYTDIENETYREWTALRKRSDSLRSKSLTRSPGKFDQTQVAEEDPVSKGLDIIAEQYKNNQTLRKKEQGIFMKRAATILVKNWSRDEYVGTFIEIMGEFPAELERTEKEFFTERDIQDLTGNMEAKMYQTKLAIIKKLNDFYSTHSDSFSREDYIKSLAQLEVQFKTLTTSIRKEVKEAIRSRKVKRRKLLSSIMASLNERTSPYSLSKDSYENEVEELSNITAGSDIEYVFRTFDEKRMKLKGPRSVRSVGKGVVDIVFENPMNIQGELLVWKNI